MLGKKASKETLKIMSTAQLNKIVPKEVGIKISIAKKGKSSKYTHSNKNKKVINKITGIEYSSISKAAKENNIRRNTLGKLLQNNEECDFKYLE